MYAYGACCFYVCCSDCVESVGMFVLAQECVVCLCKGCDGQWRRSVFRMGRGGVKK